MKISPKIISLSFAVLAILFLVIFYAIAWQEPTQAPPQGNIATPLNTGPENQTKEGGLTLNTIGSENALVIDQGNVCLGGECGSVWPEKGVFVTYRMTVDAYIQGSTYYAKSIGYSCPEGTSAVITYCSPIIKDGQDLPNYNLCSCSVGSNRATLTQLVTFCRCTGTCSCSAAGSCTPYSGYWHEDYCQLAYQSCVMEFQCGARQVISQ
jgi:hypothetical protein